MKITILTVCPEIFEGFLSSHCLERAAQLQLAEVRVVDIRDYAAGSFRAVDDSPYGGGRGMLLRCEPVVKAIRACRAEDPEARVIALTPAGKTYTQRTAHQLAEAADLVLLCGHYEGLDERILDYVDEEISLGDYILTGGEIAAMALTDSVLRLLPGNLKAGSTEEESFEQNMLEYPQYTHPREFEGKAVPEVLLSGDHGAIDAWRQAEALKKTKERRPDLLEKRPSV